MSEWRPSQRDLGLEDTRPDPTHVDPIEVRGELMSLLAEARGATDRSPWDRKTYRYHKTVFPQMANWLPEPEASDLRRAFAAELDRIAAMLEGA